MRFTVRTQYFFQKLNKRIKDAKIQGLYRVCGLIRSATRRSLRIAKGPSSPGKPPHAHTSGGLRIISFAVNGNTGMIGPDKFSGSNTLNEPVTFVQEFGGTFSSKWGYKLYPERSYMNSTLNRLHAQGLIGKEFSTTIAKVL